MLSMICLGHRSVPACLISLALFPLPLAAQVTYNLIPRQEIQRRLALYKGNDTVREAALKTLFTQAGCNDSQISEQPVPDRKQPNVICLLPGETPATIVVGAHFDHVSDGDGVIDNWSGAALLPSLFEALAIAPRTHTFIFIGFTGEEDGLLGSAFYVRSLPKEQIAKIEAMVNLDTLALGPTKVWVSQSDARLVNALGLLARTMHLPVGGMNIDSFGESDEESFIGDKVCTVTIHSLTRETAHVLHKPADNPGAVQFNDYYDTFHLLAGYLALLDSQLTADGHVCTAKPIEPSTSQHTFRTRRYKPAVAAASMPSR